MTGPSETPILARKTPWQLVAVLGALAAGILGAFLAPPRLRPVLAGGFILLCGVLLALLWRLAVSAHASFQRSKWTRPTRP